MKNGSGTISVPRPTDPLRDGPWQGKVGQVQPFPPQVGFGQFFVGFCLFFFKKITTENQTRAAHLMSPRSVGLETALAHEQTSGSQPVGRDPLEVK